MDEKIITDLQEAKAKCDSIKELFNKLYYDGGFSTLFNRPVLSMLSAACDYLSTNIDVLIQKARLK